MTFRINWLSQFQLKEGFDGLVIHIPSSGLTSRNSIAILLAPLENPFLFLFDRRQNLLHLHCISRNSDSVA